MDKFIVRMEVGSMAILSQAIKTDGCDRCGEVWFKGAMVMPMQFRNPNFRPDSPKNIDTYCYDCTTDIQSNLMAATRE